MKKGAIIIVLFLSIVCNSQAQWVYQHYTPGEINHLRTIQVSEDGFGYCMGNDNSGNGLILKTEDFGNDWTEIVNPFTSTIQDYYFNENGSLYVVSGYPAFGPGQIGFSFDGGDSWDLIMDWGYSLKAISFINSDTGSICFSDNIWTTLTGTIPIWWNYAWALGEIGILNGKVYDVVHTDSGIAYACGYYSDFPNDYGLVVKSYNYGETWDTVFVADFNSKFYSLYFVNSDTGYIGGYQSIYKTIDGGLTWIDFEINYDWEVHAIFFPTDSIGYAATGFPPNNEGAIYKTTDGGETWDFDIYENFEVNDVCFINDTIGYCSGNAETILYTEHGGGDIIYGINEKLENKLQVIAYPNPFTNTTTLEFELQENSKVQISIYNSIGEIVYQLEDQFDRGHHKINWSPNHIPSGIYFGVLRNEESMIVLKIIKH